MNKPNTGGMTSLDRIRKVKPSFDGDRSDRQNLADTMSAPERAALLLTPPTESDRIGMVDENAETPLSRPVTTRTSDAERIGRSDWFQRADIHDGIQQELIIPQSRISPAVVVLTLAAATIVLGGAIWLVVF
jgi:hypothetical protein